MRRSHCAGPALAAMLLSPGSGTAQDFPADGPFVPGETFPETPATCASLPGWMARLPDHDGRISMAVTGKLEESIWDGALAYLVLCPADQMQVVCVTYEPLDPSEGRQVTLAGGVAGADQTQVLLDPCLATVMDQ